jgi:hypothetical protein
MVPNQQMWTGDGILRGLNSAQAYFKVVMGFRPAIPDDMPQAYRDLMTACWHEDPDKRPAFEDIERFLRGQYHAVVAAAKAGMARTRSSSSSSSHTASSLY